MRHVAFYHAETGQLSPLTVMASDDDVIALNTPPGHLAIDVVGELDHKRHRVNPDTGKLEEQDAPAELPALVTQRRRNEVEAAIRGLENQQHRTVREALIMLFATETGAAYPPELAQHKAAVLARLLELDNQIEALRSQLTTT